ncbi:MAG: DUF1569 domain-containing protein [Vicinamibacterales bacterium]
MPRGWGRQSGRPDDAHPCAEVHHPDAGSVSSGIEAPRHVTPTGQPRLSALLERVSGSLAAFDDAARRAEARWGRALVLDHPILGPFTADDWRRFHRVHTRHHQRQIVERRRLAAAVPH